MPETDTNPQGLAAREGALLGELPLYLFMALWRAEAPCSDPIPDKDSIRW